MVVAYNLGLNARLMITRNDVVAKIKAFETANTNDYLAKVAEDMFAIEMYIG